jgi:diacylglycerol diphosphate phosphatase / phosphatidate phosphatase
MDQNVYLLALYECAISLSGLLYAIGLTEGITQCVKMYIGRLRPNMYQLCQFNIETLQYSTTISKEQIREGHLSFPSGHSSLASVSMVYCTWYFVHFFNQQQQRSANINLYRYSRHGLWTLMLSVLRTLFTALLLPGWAVYVGMTRIVDHWHHVSDVLAGLLLGSIVGTIVFHSIVQPILQYVKVGRNNDVRSYNSSPEQQSTCTTLGANVSTTSSTVYADPV